MTPEELKRAMQQAIDAGDFEAAYQIEQELNQSAESPSGGGFVENVMQPFNRGALQLPIESLAYAVNLNSPLPAPSSEQMLSALSNLGILPQGETPNNPVSRGAEIAGGATLPFLGAAKYGASVLQSGVAPAARSFTQNVAADVARKPGSNALFELLASYGAGVGGDLAQRSDKDQATGEVVGGSLAAMIPTLASATPSAIGARAIKNALVLRTPSQRAARRVQSTSVDPGQAAARIDPNSPMPPARQVGEPRMLALEKELRGSGSAADEESVELAIRQAVSRAQREAIQVPGDTAAAREIMNQRVANTVRSARERATAATEAAQAELSRINPQQGVGEMGQSARVKIESALDAADDAANKAWQRVGFDNQGNYSNTHNAIKEITAMAGRPAVEEGLVLPPALQRELARAADSPTTLRDIHSMRQMVQDQHRAAKLAGERQKAKWLGKLQASLLKDMEAVQGADPSALTDARKATKYIYDNFYSGAMGKVLGFSDSATQRVADPDTLRVALSGRTRAANLDSMLQSTPEMRPDAINYMRHGFLASAVRDGSVNTTAANRYIEKLRNDRVFEVLPELEQELIGMAKSASRSDILSQRASLVEGAGGRLYETGLKKSVASMYADAPVGEEAGILLGNIPNKAQAARNLVSKMDGNVAAEEGVRRSFLEAMWKRSAKGMDAEGFDTHDPALFTRLLRENKETIDALGFSGEQKKALDEFATLLRQSQATAPANESTGIQSTDIVGWLLDRGAQVGGAKIGHLINKFTPGSGAGPSLQAAAMGASSMRQIARATRVNQADAILIDALDDPKKWRELLLLPTDGSKPPKDWASRLNAWLISLGIEAETTDTP